MSPAVSPLLSSRGYLLAMSGLLGAGAIQCVSISQFSSFATLVFAASVPALIWIRRGGLGLPIVPAVCCAYIPYFAWPLVNAQRATLPYHASEIDAAARTVVLFLAAAAAAWRLVTRSQVQETGMRPTAALEGAVIRFILLALLAGIAFQLSLVAGRLGWLGWFFGLARTITFTMVMVAIFLLGMARGQRIIRGYAWGAAVIGVFVMIAASFTSLFLVTGMLYLFAAVAGYVLASRRMPWLLLAGTLAVFPVLHAGKSQMRDKYWIHQTNFSEAMSLTSIPGFMAEWVEAGLTEMLSKQRRPGVQNIADRVSLLRILLLAQRATPSYIDYLRGETYALLPDMLTPRFIDPDKPTSQAAMALLNVRYGIQTAEAAAVTAIGWGIVAEAWANFGYYGIACAGLLFGLVGGLLERFSAGRELLSIRTLLAISGMMVLINLEADFCNLVMALIQSSVSVLVFFTIYKRFIGTSRTL